MPPNNLTNGGEVPLGCSPTPATTCTDPNSKYDGIRVWLYTNTITLPSRCNTWKLSVVYNSRAGSNNLAGGKMYLWATINNQISHVNSSPVFTTGPAIFTCMNQPISYKFNITDPDGDSVAIAIAQPQTDSIATCPTINKPNGYKSLTPSINLTNNPFQTNNTFQFSSSSNNMSFLSSMAGNNILALNIKEYRNGTLIGNYLRELQVRAIACFVAGPGPPITSTAKIDTVVNGYASTLGISQVFGCIGQPLSYGFYLKSLHTIPAKYTLSSNIDTAIPNATISYWGQGTDSVRYQFNWTPTINDTGIHNFILFITDSACRPPGTILQYANNITIYIPHGVFAGNDTAICSNEPMILTAYGGHPNASYKWSKLPGATGGLTCDTCRIATATPTSTSRYAVSLTSNWCPNKYDDTIEVSILSTPVTFPTATISVLPDSNIWQWLEATFTANVTNCTKPAFQWQLNGNDITGATSAIWRSTTLVDADAITCVIKCGDSCPEPRIIVPNTITMNVAMSADDIKQDSHIAIHPNPNNGSFRLHITTKQEYEQPTSIEISDMLGRRIYTDAIKLNVGHTMKDIHLRNISSGIYLMKVLIDNRMQVIRVSIE